MTEKWLGAGPSVGSNQYGLDAELFTRGTGENQNRGESMVQKHLQKQQEEKENKAIQQLSGLMPQFGATVRILALKEVEYDVDAAVAMLRAFQTQHDEQLKVIHKKRKKLQAEEEEALKQAEEDAKESSSSSSSSSSESGSDSGSESDSSSGEDRKRKRSRKERDGRDKKDSKKRSSKRKERDSKRGSKRKKKESRDKKRKKDKKEKDSKKDKAKPKSLTASDNFGRFGIIRETDAAAKRSEFVAWATEVKKVDVELLSRPDERELFKDYMEDFNTGTLPHRKYYNMELYEREKAIKRAQKEGKHADKKPRAAMLDDEEALRRQREEERQKLAKERLQQAYEELQHTGKAADMREQELLRYQMQVAYKTGDTEKAHKLLQKLMPDEEKRAKGLIK